MGFPFSYIYIYEPPLFKDIAVESAIEKECSDDQSAFEKECSGDKNDRVYKKKEKLNDRVYKKKGKLKAKMAAPDLK